MRLTNIGVARALGWNLERRQAAPLPRFTTSFDATLAEIKIRGLGWRVDAVHSGQAVVAQVFAKDFRGFTDGRFSTASADTEELALCLALVGFLKSEKEQRSEN